MGILARHTAALATRAAVLAALVAVFAVGGAYAAGPAHAAAAPTAASSGLAQLDASLLAARQPSPEPTSEETAPPGPRIDPEESEQATEDRTRNKAIIGAVAFGLLVIVILGRKARNKSKPGKGKGS